MAVFGLAAAMWLLFGVSAALAQAPATNGPEQLRFSRHVVALFSRLGCNGGTCHGAVQGQKGYRLALFATNPELDYEQTTRRDGARRIDRLDPDRSLILLKATAQVPHGGGKRIAVDSPEYAVLRRWIAEGAPLDTVEQSQVVRVEVEPAERTIAPGETFALRVTAEFADGTREDVTALSTFSSLDKQVAAVDENGLVRCAGVGDTPLVVRYRSESAMALVLVPGQLDGPFPDVTPHNFIDERVLAKLRRLNLPPAPLCDDETFLRRVRLDVTGQLPAPDEIRQFLADKDPNKRSRKIEQLLGEPGYAALWTLKFCDLLGSSEFGVYADGMKLEDDAPRFQGWVRARIEENLPYDQFVTRILTATSREGRSLEEWSQEISAMADGTGPERKDLEIYSHRQTLDLFWQRKAAAGVPGAVKAAHTFLGLRLECAQCHRHPHDVWQQDDLLSFANFFMRVRKPGFQGENEKKFPEAAALVKGWNDEAKKLAEEAKKLKEGPLKELDAQAKAAKTTADKLRAEITKLEADGATAPLAEKKKELDAQLAKLAAFEEMNQKASAMDRRSKALPEAGKRILHAEVALVPDPKALASVTSPLGTQSSQQFRLLGESQPRDIAAEEDPRQLLAQWMCTADNPFFAKAIVNRVWAHYFGRGIIDPPDQLSSLNPPSHPQLLDELCRGFVEHGFDLKWLHRTILSSRTYQQSSAAHPASAMDRSNYAYFYYRRLPAEVLLDAVNQATGTTENMDMKFYNWPDQVSTIEIPYVPRNAFVKFMIEQFGRPERNSAVQCDCERDGNASMLQVLSLANHPRMWQKIADPQGRVAQILTAHTEDTARIDQVFLVTLGRLPDAAEREATLAYLRASESADKGLQGILWSLLNTREFLLQH